MNILLLLLAVVLALPFVFLAVLSAMEKVVPKKVLERSLPPAQLTRWCQMRALYYGTCAAAILLLTCTPVYCSVCIGLLAVCMAAYNDKTNL